MNQHGTTILDKTQTYRHKGRGARYTVQLLAEQEDIEVPNRCEDGLQSTWKSRQNHGPELGEELQVLHGLVHDEEGACKQRRVK